MTRKRTSPPKTAATQKKAPIEAAGAKPAAQKKQEVSVAAAKGRPMLTWVGKRPLKRVTAFPAQLVETFNPLGEKGGWQNLLFHGDNKEVLAWLLANGFRGKVNLIYIDPPFDSGADYVRKVQLRGVAGVAKIDGETYTLGEQIQYTDIWANDNYLQFMYERLLLLREIMAENSVIFLHADPGRNYQLRTIMDEVFGADSFRNEIVWWYWNKMQGNINRFASNHDTLISYQKGDPPFKKIQEEREDIIRQLKGVWDPKSGSLVNAKDQEGNLIYIERAEKTLDDVWRFSMLQPADETENLHFPTQKPESLLDIIIESSSQPGGLVLDCFIGSGTTAAVAQKLGRRWIGCDINKGAVQTTAKRLQSIIGEQIEAERQGRLMESEGSDHTKPASFSFSVYRVNDYDLAIQHNEAVNLACEHLGVQRTRTDAYFDGTLGKRLVKIVPLAHPLTLLDLEELERELKSRPKEDRDVVLVCLGKEPVVDGWLAERTRHRPVNKIEVVELRTDKKYGKFFTHRPATARVEIKRAKGKIVVEIKDFISPSIVERLSMDQILFKAQITDWRAMVDSVMIDPAYDGEVFNVALSDVPERKTDLVAGRYELPAPAGPTTVAVRITDMLGEEVLIVKRPE